MPHFHPPHIMGAKNFGEYLTALQLWWAFRALRDAHE